jgi:transposase
LTFLHEQYGQTWAKELKDLLREMKEFSARRAALTRPESNGPVEGNVTKLKLIKRSMYRRGSYEYCASAS